MLPDNSIAETPRIVVFDLDVTLTRYDTFLPFVIGYLRHQRKRRILALWRLPASLLKFWHWRDPGWVKNKMLRAFLGGQPRARVEAWANRFASELIDDAMRAEGMARLREYQREGARVILASASLEVYVEPLARLLGITETLATRVAWDHNDRLVGMAGANCREDEKLRRVKSLPNMPTDGSRVNAYSDSHADLPLLSWAENGVAVCPSKRLSHQIGGLGLEIARW